MNEQVVRARNQTCYFIPLILWGYLLLHHNSVYPDRYKLLQFFHFIDREVKATLIASNHSGLNLLMVPTQRLELILALICILLLAYY